MVKTRNRPDADGSPGTEFVSLRGRSSKRGVHSDSEDYGGLSSAEEITPQSKRQRVTVRGRASRSLDTSTPVDYPQRSRSRHLDETPMTTYSPRRTRSISTGKKYRNHVKEEQHDEDEIVRSPRTKRVPRRFRETDEEDTEVVTNQRKDRRSNPRDEEEEQEEEEDDDQDEEVITQPRRGRRGKRGRAQSRPRRVYDNDRGNDDESTQVAPRRSNRERKMIYSTMNQSLIGNCYSSSGLWDWDYSQSQKGSYRIGNTSEDVERFSPLQSADLLLSGGADVSPPVSSSRRKKKQGGAEKEEEEEEDQKSVKSDRGSLDMYSRIKNRRIAQQEETQDGDDNEEEEEEDDSEEDSDEDSSDDDDTSSEEESSEEEPGRKNYSLRRQRRPPDRFEARIEEPIPRHTLKDSLFDQALSPLRRHFNAHSSNLTPIRSPHFTKRSRKHATHHSSSTSSDSDDERRFDRRKKKSMAKARMRCLPMNLNAEDVASGVVRDRQRIGSSLADVDPMTIDSNVTFESVGGLGRHVQSLKEMVVFPLLYPEVFERFKITPPRGVLFHGPPGTGKTLVARALANECRHGDKRVAFFMRKGADCLSKWVGESERQLRLLFDQAFQMRPSIIFFDEIDGLAPVRSSRQDQIHSSIVSTLLALMDGLDCRGEIVVIGATNRIDSIDPALRRPGRFDREFLFPLPSRTARESILTIHTKEWNPKLSETFIREVAEKCVGYCGADIKALCTEAGLSALRHQYPQIYASKEKLKLDLSRIQISARDFLLAMQTIVPAAQRAVVAPGRSLSFVIKPLLENQLNSALEVVKRLVPAALYSTSKHEGQDNSDANNMVMDMLNEDDFSEEDDEGPCIFANPPTKGSGHRRRILSELDGNEEPKPFMNFTCAAYNKPSTHRPRLLLAGNKGQGQSSHLAPAILHHLERLPVHCLDLAALYAVSAKSPEESCAHIFREARRTSPSIIYMPHICQWWESSGDTTRATFLTLLQDLPPTAPILVLATSDTPLRNLPLELQVLFGSYYGEVITMRQFTDDERRIFFEELILVQAAKVPVKKKRAAAVALQVLEMAPPPEPITLTQQEKKTLQEKEERTLRELRLFLRDVLSRLATEKKFRVFAKPVDPEEVPDYSEVVKNPMDLSTMMNKINMHKYTKARQFLDDIDLITRNALEYNPDRHPEDRIIRNRACELKDSAYAIVQTEMDSEFEKLCGEIVESRHRRGDSPAKTAPDFYRVLPKNADGKITALAQSFDSYPTRFSRRALGMESEQLSAAEEAMLYASCRPERKRPKPKRRLKSRWSRGFVPNMKKKKPNKVVEEENEEEESEEEENEEEDNQEDDDAGGQEIVENGVMEEGEKDDQSKEDGEEPVQENCIDAVLVGKSGNSPRVNNHCSDDESVQSGEVVTNRRLTRRSGRLPRRGSQSSEAHPHSNTHSPAASTSLSPTSLQPTVVMGRRSRGSSPRVLERSPVVPETNHNKDAVSDHESEQTIENGPVEKETCNSISEDGPTSSLDPLSSLDNDLAQEQRDGDDEKMDTEEREVASEDKQKENDKENEAEGETQEQKDTRMVTRRMIAEKEAERAREILEASLPKLVVDIKRLEALLDHIVEKTSSFNIERLERLYCSLSQCIYQHRREYNKMQLIQDMEMEVDRVMRLTAF